MERADAPEPEIGDTALPPPPSTLAIILLLLLKVFLIPEIPPPEIVFIRPPGVGGTGVVPPPVVPPPVGPPPVVPPPVVPPPVGPPPVGPPPVGPPPVGPPPVEMPPVGPPPVVVGVGTAPRATTQKSSKAARAIGTGRQCPAILLRKSALRTLSKGKFILLKKLTRPIE